MNHADLPLPRFAGSDEPPGLFRYRLEGFVIRREAQRDAKRRRASVDRLASLATARAAVQRGGPRR